MGIISGLIGLISGTFEGLPGWLQAMIILATVDMTIDLLATHKWIPQGKMYYAPLAFKLESTKTLGEE